MTDDEFASLSALTSQVYTVAVYTALLGIIDGREGISNTRDRLKFYFLARNVEIDVEDVPQGTSDILVGGEL